MTTVRISSGRVRGTCETGIFSFKGIPYAEPLAGLRRWLPPQPRRPWDGVFEAQRYGAASMQFNNGKTPSPLPRARRRYFEAIRGEGPEGDDCLVLNVWTPSIDSTARLPVMVYIHGGGFTQGAAFELYDAAPFARKGVVAVAIQYRLGPPGFLHGSGLFGEDVCADNRAFLDQLAALRWVQDNIAQFGGDASNVTIFGESAGAFSVYQLSASPLAKGLFRRAIAMGGMPDTCAPAEEYHRLSRDALSAVGVRAGDTRALAALDRAALQALQAAVSKLIFSGKDADRYGSISRTRIPFLGAATKTAFLPQAPMQAYRHGTPNDIDLMLGTCDADGRLFSLMMPLPMKLSARLFSPKLSGLMPGGDLQRLRRQYRAEIQDLGRGSVSEQINNDAFFRMPTIAAAEAHASSHPGRTYLYQVDYSSAIAGLGAVHGIEVALLFGPSRGKALIHRDTATEQLSERMLEAWTSFARDGVPAASGIGPWRSFNAETRCTMVFDRDSRLEADWGKRFRQYWSGTAMQPPAPGLAPAASSGGRS